jgi:hypothetical protein
VETFWTYFTMRPVMGAVFYTDSVLVMLSPAAESTVQFVPSLPVTTFGGWTMSGWCELAGDRNPANDLVNGTFFVPGSGGIVWPHGWKEIKSLPLLPSNRMIKDGGALAVMDELIYATKGYKTSEFYSYDYLTNQWTPRTLVPMGREGKPPYKGTQLVSDNNGHIYLVKGNNTLGFWKYTAVDSSWAQMTDVPLGTSGKRVKGGDDIAYVEKGGRGYVYLLKGYRNEFFRYSLASGTWQSLTNAPIGVKVKWDKGSFIVYDGDRTIYAHKGKYSFGDPAHHELWAYDVITGQWGTSSLRGLPLYGLYSGSLRRKKAADGAAGAWYGGELYALKGGNTLSLFGGAVPAGDWAQLADMPTGSSGRRAKTGADLDCDGAGTLYALKGNKTGEFYRFVIGDKSTGDGIAAAGQADRPRITPTATLIRGVLNLTPDISTLTSDIVLLDVSGRKMLDLAPGPNDVSALAPGIYFVRQSAVGREPSSVSKVVVTR